MAEGGMTAGVTAEWAVEADDLTRVFRTSWVQGRSIKVSDHPGMLLAHLHHRLTGRLRHRERRAVDRICFRVPCGAFVGLLGPNGSGKSTLLKLIAGLIAPSAGRLRVLGADAAHRPRALLERTNFIPGVLTGGAWVESSLTPRRNLRFVAELFGMAPSDAEIDRVLGWLGMSEWADSRVGTLSSGTTAKLQLAFGLMRKAPIYLLDEPTEGVAPEIVAEIRRILLEMNRQAGVTILYATHHLLEAQDMFSHVAVLGQGRLLAYGSPRALTAALGAVEGVQVEVGDWQPAALPALLDQPALHDLARDLNARAEAETGQCELRFLTPDSRQALPLVIQSLIHSGCRIRHVDVSRPTLEDVYLHAVRGLPAEPLVESRTEGIMIP
jgi:ABC-2 type transport system ATP-binding protein